MRSVLVGCGRWGSKLLAALRRHPAITVQAVVDPDPAALERAAGGLPSGELLCTGRLGDALAAAAGLEAAFIATPPALHARHGLQALAAGLDVLIEKPLALTVADARRLCAAQRGAGAVGMVGHILRYHPAVEQLIALVRGGAVGPVRELCSWRRTGSHSPDPLWTLAPHDLSTLHALDGSAVAQLTAAADRRSDDPGAVRLSLTLASGLQASLELSTTAPRPERRLIVRGDSGLIAVDELAPDSPLTFVISAAPAARRVAQAAAELSRSRPAEPLQRQLDHFVSCVRSRREPRTSLSEGEWIVAVLEHGQRCLDRGAGARFVAAAR